MTFRRTSYHPHPNRSAELTPKPSPVKGEGTFKEHHYSPSPGGRGLGKGGEKRKFLTNCIFKFLSNWPPIRRAFAIL